MALDFYKNLPKKRMSSGALFFDEEGKILIVKPTYKDGWEIPGGSVESDESPLEALKREVKEELGLDIGNRQLLLIDYVRNNDDKGDRLSFIFEGGTLTADDIKTITLPVDELSKFRFVEPDEAKKLLRDKVGKRIASALEALKAGKFFYLEDSAVV